MADRAPDEHLDIWRECLTRAEAVTDPSERLGAWRDIRVAFPAVLDELVAERARAEAAEADLTRMSKLRVMSEANLMRASDNEYRLRATEIALDRIDAILREAAVSPTRGVRGVEDLATAARLRMSALDAARAKLSAVRERTDSWFAQCVGVPAVDSYEQGRFHGLFDCRADILAILDETEKQTDV